MDELRVYPEKTYQTFERFGVSGAWWAQVVGGWDETDPASGKPKRERVAELLFNPEKGIGVRCYRYNLGGGSAQSGKGYFSMPCRRAESFDTGENEFDWSRDANAVWMLRQAVKEGADEVILFVNSPPERYTKNGKTQLDKPLRTNLPRKNHKKFANYCLACAEHFIAEGIPVKYLSPVNEPVWVWTGANGQEGCHYRPRQVRKLMRTFAEEMDKRPALKELKLSGAENGDIRWFNKTYTRIMLGDRRLRGRVDAVDVHSYFVTPEIPVLKHFIKNRLPYLRRFRRYLDRHFPYAQVKTSEWTHMRGGRDYGMDSALEQTKIILEDLTVLNVSSWQLWIAVSNVDYCDGLIYENDGPRTFELTRRYYAFGNFTKFIEPGSKRCGISVPEGVTAAAFTKDGRQTAVLMNPGDDAKTLALPPQAAAVYLTDETHDLAGIEARDTLTIPPKSVVTVLFAPERGNADA